MNVARIYKNSDRDTTCEVKKDHDEPAINASLPASSLANSNSAHCCTVADFDYRWSCCRSVPERFGQGSYCRHPDQAVRGYQGCLQGKQRQPGGRAGFNYHFRKYVAPCSGFGLYPTRRRKRSIPAHSRIRGAPAGHHCTTPKRASTCQASHSRQLYPIPLGLVNGKYEQSYACWKGGVR